MRGGGGLTFFQNVLAVPWLTLKYEGPQAHLPTAALRRSFTGPPSQPLPPPPPPRSPRSPSRCNFVPLVHDLPRGKHPETLLPMINLHLPPPPPPQGAAPSAATHRGTGASETL